MLRVHSEEGILSVTLDSPPWNILTTELLDSLDRVLDEGSRASVSALVLSGAGKGFCAGASVEEHFPDRVEAMLVSLRRALLRLRHFPVPTVCVVHGAALGGGLELAMAADVLFAAEGTKLGQPEVRLAAIAPAALVFLPRRVGYHRAADLLFSGRHIEAREAEAWGLVDRVCPPDRVNEEAHRFAGAIAGHSEAVLREYKRALLEVSPACGGLLERTEQMYLSRLVRRPDYLEGLNAFLEKRDPKWQGAGE